VTAQPALEERSIAESVLEGRRQVAAAINGEELADTAKTSTAAPATTSTMGATPLASLVKSVVSGVKTALGGGAAKAKAAKAK